MDKKLIRYRDQMIYPPPEKIIWCYRTWQPTYTDLIGQVEFVKGLNYKIDGNQATLLVLDDMMMQLNDDIVNLFVAGRHDNVSVIFVTHNIFFKKLRTIALNTQYLVLFKNVRDGSQIQCLARQMFPGKSKYVLEAFQDATSPAFGYILFDFKPNTPDHFRLRTNIFPGEQQYTYVPL